jgi:hypothetical protein
MYRLSEKDIQRLVVACKEYQSNTGSIYMFDEYTKLIEKLNTYAEQIFEDDNGRRH